MNILYLSSSCSEEKFKSLQEQGITRSIPQAQKYHALLRDGIEANLPGSIRAISLIATNPGWTKQFFFKREQEVCGKIPYTYVAFVNRPVLKQWSVYRSGKKAIKEAVQGKKELILICDVLNVTLAKAARKMGKKYGLPVIGIVTDVPGLTSGAQRKSYSFFRRFMGDMAEKQAKKDMLAYDGYLLLTEAMNGVVNLKKKPYLVMEGHSDIRMKNKAPSLSHKAEPKVLMYAGGIHREYGIALLTEAFLAGGFSDWELHIYGDGNYREELTRIGRENKNVKYFGLKPNEKIVEAQLKATLLVNPRPTEAEYVKYSFPSKTMECMASGTPLLTTRLPGMPEEYKPHVYFFDEESVEGFSRTLKELLALPAEELYNTGKGARDFVLKEKNNVKQAEKLIKFLKENYEDCRD